MPLRKTTTAAAMVPSTIEAPRTTLTLVPAPRSALTLHPGRARTSAAFRPPPRTVTPTTERPAAIDLSATASSRTDDPRLLAAIPTGLVIAVWGLLTIAGHRSRRNTG